MLLSSSCLVLRRIANRGTGMTLHEIIWQNACAKRYRSDPEEIRQTVREKRIQREIDERVRRQVLGNSEDKEQPPAPEEVA